MASHPAPRSAGQRRLVTYGSSGRKKTNLVPTRERDFSCFAPPRKSHSPTTSDQTIDSASVQANSSKTAPGLQTSAAKGSTERGGNGSEQLGDRKRKRTLSEASAANDAHDRRASLKNGTKAIADVPQRIPKTARGVNLAYAAPCQAQSRRSPGVPSSTELNATPPRSRRRRLIDALAAQRAASPEQAPNQAEEEVELASDQASSPPSRPTTALRELRLCAADRRGATPTRRKIRLTYSQSFSTPGKSRRLDELDRPAPDPPDETALSDMQVPSSPMGPASADEDDNAHSKPAIKSVHELRRAGANNRFADEMDDLLARIGNPGAGSLTMRRNALCELAHRLARESFAGQFRDHGCRDNVAKGIGREEDVVSGFALAAALVIFLRSGSAPHLLQKLAEEGLGKMLGRLIRVSEDIDAVASRRKMNLSRSTRASVHGLKGTLVQMPIWHGLGPAHLSPRTLGLQLLETVSRCSDGQLLEQLMGDLETDLVSVAADCAGAGAGTDVLDHALAIFALEALSSAGVTPGATGHSSIATFLRRALQLWPRERGALEAATLKLAINTTNTDRGATAFDSPDLILLLAGCIGGGFATVLDAIGGRCLADDGMYDELLLILGVTINIVEHSPSARGCWGDKALDDLVALWQGNQLAVNEADSVDKTKVSVAVGYLAVLLGYLCLDARARERVKARVDSGEEIRGLVGSIRDFVAMYKTVDSKAHELEALVVELSQAWRAGRVSGTRDGRIGGADREEGGRRQRHDD